ncbi:neural Wiskott-Aldrich syndrome protein-like isoform X2 [Polyodon spathula]|uniref:neural Wiskott-Aldrich syndrome protein-like isoform X2 n=1 Tax=Polyodon spathula TaxID=7913 RepID=UPI001B7DAE82|nr:neural Wiskott-Aldrich syndrome protein-like isoform X2 [Polyodon spathula]
MHVGHVGWNPGTGFDINHLDSDLRQLFSQAGIQQRHLQDLSTSQLIYEVIELQGGMEAVRQEIRGQGSIASLSLNRIAPPVSSPLISLEPDQPTLLSLKGPLPPLPSQREWRPPMASSTTFRVRGVPPPLKRGSLSALFTDEAIPPPPSTPPPPPQIPLVLPLHTALHPQCRHTLLPLHTALHPQCRHTLLPLHTALHPQCRHTLLPLHTALHPQCRHTLLPLHTALHPQ